MKRLLFLLVVLWGGGAYAWWSYTEAGNAPVTYRTEPVRRGDLESAIDATGTIEPEEVVDVGAQVAAQIRSFGADPADPDRPIGYGTHVEAGTVLAQLDDALYIARRDQAKSRLTKAEADVRKADAKLRQARRDLDRQQRLQSRGEGLASQEQLEARLADFEATEADLAVAKSAVEVAEADLEEAVANLGYTTIRSPVRGVILDRRVNIGQTVVASLNAPSLFLIAKDLSRLEIWASINENDIGAIHVGQPVRFGVSAFPGRTFRGEVLQIRLNASMVQSVVTYTVVVAVDNADGTLLPYLTARLHFEVDRREGVLLVPNAALRWQPKPQEIDPDFGDAAALAKRRSPGSAEGTVWVARGPFVRPLAVRVGLSDGAKTEITGEGLGEETEVVVGATRPVEANDVSAILPYTNTNK